MSKLGIISIDLNVVENGLGSYSSRELKRGEVVYMYTGFTYGCISDGGIAVTYAENGSEPFFEVPADSVNWEK